MHQQALSQKFHTFRVIQALVRASILTQAQYRIEFLLQMSVSGFWAIFNLVPMFLVFRVRSNVAGWTENEALLVVAFFVMLRAFIQMLVSPNLSALVEHIRKGTFDFILLKPGDSQLLASFQKFVPFKFLDFIVGFILFLYCIFKLPEFPPYSAIILGLTMLIVSSVLMYSLWLTAACAAFWFVKTDNLAFLLTSVFDAARWPIDIFRGVVRLFLTFILPVAVMTSLPAQIVLGRLGLKQVLFASLGASIAFILSRKLWTIAIRRYSSASS